MKKISVITVILILFHFSGYSQELKNQLNSAQEEKNQSSGSKYSSFNLWKTSPQDLNLYLKKAKGLKTTGIVATIAGPVLMGVGVGMIAGWDERGIGLFFTGVGVTAVGIPVWVVGSGRVKRVKSAINSHRGADLSIAPDFISMNMNKNIYPGIKLSLRF